MEELELIEGLEEVKQRTGEVLEDTAPDAINARFIVESVHQPYLSAMENKDVYKNVVMIEVVYELGRSAFKRPIYDQVENINGKWKVLRLGRPVSDIEKYKKEWNAFARGNVDGNIGTPLDILFITDPSRVEMYKYHHVRSLEQLAALSDASCQSIGLGAQEDRSRAARYLKSANEGAPLASLQMKLVEKDNRISTLEAQLNQLSSQFHSFMAKEDEGIEVPKKRGRPKVIKDEAPETQL